jgi:Protein of unknown function DUF58
VENPHNKPNVIDKNNQLARVRRVLASLFHKALSGPTLGPLSTRSVIALLLMLYLLLGPIQTSTDIVSASLSYAFFILLGMVVGVALVHGTVLKRRIAIDVTPPSEPAISGETVRVILSIQGARILPFFSLDIALEFEHQGFSPALVRVSGFTRGERHAHLDIVFPHRGSWDIHTIHCVLRDVTGLSLYTWRIPLTTAVTVSPPPVSDSRLPVLSSTQRPGDMMIDVFNRQGEPFDIKSYHPSDGVKKIVWKAFAKRGELLSRHPEASMTPEGFVVMLVIAGPEGDPACAHAVAYSRSLAQLNLEIIASCEGAHGRSPAHSPESFEELLIDSVWDATPDTPGHLRRDTAALLDYCGQLTPSITVSKLLLFVSAERIGSAQNAQELYDLAEWLSDQGVQPVLCLTDPPAFAEPTPRSPLARMRRFVVAPDTTQSPRISAEAYNNFLSSCLHKQWEVYV